MGSHETMVEHPLKDIESLDQMTSYFEEHGFPDPRAEGRFDLAKEQADAGADFIDVNVGTGVGTLEDEIESMREEATEILSRVED